MKIFSPSNPVAADVSPLNPFCPVPRSTAAFTMVEIALCLAIVGFALVAIVGVLPAGLNVQKENREDTILNQDATIWFDALRAGGGGGFSAPNAPGTYDDLTNYVDRIVIVSQNYDDQTNKVGGPLYFVGEWNGPIPLTNGARIVGMLSTPKITGPTMAPPAAYSSNYVYAYVRAISGNATDKAPQDNQDVRDLAFSYRMVVDVSPVGTSDLEGIQTNAVDRVLRRNLTDVRLLFRWPLQRPFVAGQSDPSVGNSRMSFRTQLGGRIMAVPDVMPNPTHIFYYLQPRDF